MERANPRLRRESTKSRDLFWTFLNRNSIRTRNALRFVNRAADSDADSQMEDAETIRELEEEESE